MGWQIDRADGALVDDVEDSSAGGDHCAHAGEVFVAPGVFGSAGPAQSMWRTDHRVLRYGVVGGVMEEVSPLVQLVWPGLGGELRF
ncbi:MAG: hypothetical protein ACYSWZ_14050 [Planctomycetota bacterium]